jgi:beta-aspartyl-peptidase (threonine type)
VAELYVHGGVSGVERDQPPLSYVFAAPPEGSALDIVERAVRLLEDDPSLNAGFGATLTRDGRIELDAGIVDGAGGRVGAVAGVRVRNPISAARRVLEETPHVFLVGEGAIGFAGDAELLERTSDEQHARWDAAKAANRLGPDDFGAPEHVDTVGAVALDDDGYLAAGSSTGGVFAKMLGRVGDAPIFGAGIYASERVAVVGTGVGELFLETLACARVGWLVENGEAPQDACTTVIELLGERAPTAAGLLALDNEGRAGHAYRGGSWSVAGTCGSVSAARVD